MGQGVPTAHVAKWGLPVSAATLPSGRNIPPIPGRATRSSTALAELDMLAATRTVTAPEPDVPPTAGVGREEQCHMETETAAEGRERNRRVFKENGRSGAPCAPGQSERLPPSSAQWYGLPETVGPCACRAQPASGTCQR